MAIQDSNSALVLALANGQSRGPYEAPWAGPLVALGGMLARRQWNLAEDQLVVTVSVPRREYAAILTGCGWILGSTPAAHASPAAAFASMTRGELVRLVTKRDVVVDEFEELIEVAGELEVRLKKTQWKVASIGAVSVLTRLDTVPGSRRHRPLPGFLPRWAEINRQWDNHLASPADDLAIVGIARWIEEELETEVSLSGASNDGVRSSSDALFDLLRPSPLEKVCPNARLYPSAHLAESVPLPSDIQCVILDGSAAVHYLPEIEVPLVLCVIDRSIADESAEETILDMRRTRGTPFSLENECGWRSPKSIEAVAFTTPL